MRQGDIAAANQGGMQNALLTSRMFLSAVYWIEQTVGHVTVALESSIRGAQDSGSGCDQGIPSGRSGGEALRDRASEQ